MRVASVQQPCEEDQLAGKQLEGTASASHRQRQRSNPSCSTSQTWVALGRSRQLVTAMLVTGLPGSRMIVWFRTCYIIMVMQYANLHEARLCKAHVCNKSDACRTFSPDVAFVPFSASHVRSSVACATRLCYHKLALRSIPLFLGAENCYFRWWGTQAEGEAGGGGGCDVRSTPLHQAHGGDSSAGQAASAQCAFL